MFESEASDGVTVPPQVLGSLSVPTMWFAVLFLLVVVVVFVSCSFIRRKKLPPVPIPATCPHKGILKGQPSTDEQDSNFFKFIQNNRNVDDDDEVSGSFGSDSSISSYLSISSEKLA
ncbi:hypothetical protein V1264_024504 [Littorina saxatilis]|uniref:Uncharacterized protein n=1 Tax=Littorina saxatilis TaxID=31220 RepID=A0AAN9AMA1_9CAEN